MGHEVESIEEASNLEVRAILWIRRISAAVMVGAGLWGIGSHDFPNRAAAVVWSVIALYIATRTWLRESK